MRIKVEDAVTAQYDVHAQFMGMMLTGVQTCLADNTAAKNAMLALRTEGITVGSFLTIVTPCKFAYLLTEVLRCNDFLDMKSRCYKLHRAIALHVDSYRKSAKHWAGVKVEKFTLKQLDDSPEESLLKRLKELADNEPFSFSDDDEE